MAQKGRCMHTPPLPQAPISKVTNGTAIYLRFLIRETTAEGLRQSPTPQASQPRG